MRNVLGCLLVVFVLAGACFGQGTTSRLVGTVSDPSGGVIPGAKVTLTNEETSVSFTSTSTEAGTFVFEALQVGKYRL